MKHGKNFTLGEYVIIKKPELVKVGNNVRIADFCRITILRIRSISKASATNRSVPTDAVCNSSISVSNG